MKIIRTIKISIGLNPATSLKNFFKPFFRRDLQKIKKQIPLSEKKEFPIGPYYPIDERADEAGTMSGGYFHQDLYVAKQLFEKKPSKHIDIGSRIDGFIAHVAVFREIEIFDIRPIKSHVKNIIFKQADLMLLPPEMENYCDSISALHSIEHFGLGRYGDPVDYEGHIKAIKNITKILKSNGIFYFSIPIGKQRIEFNAHRVFHIDYIWNLLKPYYKLITFSFIDEKGDFHEDIQINDKRINPDLMTMYEYGVGIFVLRKISN